MTPTLLALFVVLVFTGVSLLAFVAAEIFGPLAWINPPRKDLL